MEKLSENAKEINRHVYEAIGRLSGNSVSVDIPLDGIVDRVHRRIPGVTSVENLTFYIRNSLQALKKFGIVRHVADDTYRMGFKLDRPQLKKTQAREADLTGSDSSADDETTTTKLNKRYTKPMPAQQHKTSVTGQDDFRARPNEPERCSTQTNPIAPAETNAQGDGQQDHKRHRADKKKPHVSSVPLPNVRRSPVFKVKTEVRNTDGNTIGIAEYINQRGSSVALNESSHELEEAFLTAAIECPGAAELSDTDSMRVNYSEASFSPIYHKTRRTRFPF